MSSATNPESGTSSYLYDNNGNLTNQYDGRNQLVYRVYDALNRVTIKTHSAGTPDVYYSYDAANVPYSKGRLTGVSVTGGSSTAYTNYNPLGRVTTSSQTTNGNNYSFTYGYNPSGSLSWEIYPSGRVVTQTFDGANRPQAAGSSYLGVGTNYVTGATYAAHGGVAGYALGKVNRSYTYNSRLQPIDIRDTQQGQANYLLDLDLYWGDNATQTTNNNGNLRGEGINTNNGPTLSAQINSWQPFTYDNVKRLLGMSDSASGASQQFGYDQFGNRTIGVNGMAAQAPSSVYSGATNRSNLLTYDAAGNQLSSNYQLLTYDAEERISQAYDNVSGDTMTFAYDGDGKRVSKTAGGNTTVYVYDALGSLAAEYHSWTGYGSRCTKCYLSLDHLGSTRMVTDQNGELVSRHDYYPFGDEIPAVGGRTSVWGATDEVRQMFTGKERDSESRLDYFGARYYGSALGRFTSPDVPLADQHEEDPQSWNLYSYVRNNPLKNIDPLGMDCITTSNQSSSGVSVTTERGGSAETCSGTYVNGTVNTNSYQYNGTNLTYSFANDTTSGAGNIQFTRSLDSDALSPGVANMLRDAGNRAAPFVNSYAALTLGFVGVATGAEIADLVGGSELASLGRIAPNQIIKPSPGQVAQMERVLAQQGRQGVEKALRTLEERVAEHADKIGAARDAGGYTSSMEREVRNFRGLIEAAKQVLNK